MEVALTHHLPGKPFVGQMNGNGRNDPGIGPAVQMIPEKVHGVGRYHLDTGRYRPPEAIDHEDIGTRIGVPQAIPGQPAKTTGTHDPENAIAHHGPFIPYSPVMRPTGMVTASPPYHIGRACLQDLDLIISAIGFDKQHHDLLTRNFAISRMGKSFMTSNSVATGDLILASQSPRRKYLLEQAGLNFRVIPSRIDESCLPLSSPADYVQDLALAKAKDIAKDHPESWVLGADTIVTVDNRMLGKPASVPDARDMLQRLSGKTHQVYTGFCLVYRHGQRCIQDTTRTEVTFKTLTPKEIDWYINTGEPFDKAGAYAIQGLGTFLVRRINGSYTNVVGLPVCEVVEILLREGVMGLEG